MYHGNEDEVPFRSTNKTLSLEAALMYDSLLVLATAAKNLEYHMDSILFRHQDGNVSCENETPWMEGTTFFNYLNAVTVTGLTGNISFQVRNALWYFLTWSVIQCKCTFVSNFVLEVVIVLERILHRIHDFKD